MIEFSNSKVPINFVLPPTFKFSSIPTPPSVIKDPVSLVVDVVVSSIFV